MRAIVNQYYDIQHMRLEAENQVRAIKQGKAEGDEEFIREVIIKRLTDTEKEIKKYCQKKVKEEDIYEWLGSVKGIGPVLASGLIAYIVDPERYKDPSHLWAYAGLHVIDGKAVKRAKGQKANWNSKLKTLCWLVGESFVKQKAGSKYRDLYDQNRAFYDTKFPKESKGHQYAMAKRKTVKMFLAHLYGEWMSIRGHKARKPYVIDKLGHKGYISA